MCHRGEAVDRGKVNGVILFRFCSWRARACFYRTLQLCKPLLYLFLFPPQMRAFRLAVGTFVAQAEGTFTKTTENNFFFLIHIFLFSLFRYFCHFLALLELPISLQPAKGANGMADKRKEFSFFWLAPRPQEAAFFLFADTALRLHCLQCFII